MGSEVCATSFDCGSTFGDVVFWVPFGIGKIQVSLMTMSDFAHAKLSTWFDGCQFALLCLFYCESWRFEPQSKPHQVTGLKVGHGFKWFFSLVIKVVNCGVGFWVGNLANQCSFRVAMSSPTIRPREQADLARYRSFVMNQWRFGLWCHGWSDRLSRDGCVDVSLVGQCWDCVLGSVDG